MFEIRVREDPNPFFARIIIAKDWNGNIDKAKSLLEEIFKKWPKERKVKFVITCGGFIQFDWPQSLTREDIGDNKNPNREAVEILAKEGEKCAKYVLGDLREKLSDVTDYLTLGIDSYKEKISITQNYISELHIELVYLADLQKNKIYWTGKSYPTSSQEKGLVRISDLESHFFDLSDVGKIMILGCHDLNIFNPRSKNAKGWRRDVNGEFRELTKLEYPEYVFQHPHTTVKVRTWLNAWNELSRMLLSLKIYGSAGRFSESNRNPSVYDSLEDVLKKTKKGDSIDVIVG